MAKYMLLAQEGYEDHFLVGNIYDESDFTYVFKRHKVTVELIVREFPNDWQLIKEEIIND